MCPAEVRAKQKQILTLATRLESS